MAKIYASHMHMAKNIIYGHPVRSGFVPDDIFFKHEFPKKKAWGDIVVQFISDEYAPKKILEWEKRIDPYTRAIDIVWEIKPILLQQSLNFNCITLYKIIQELGNKDATFFRKMLTYTDNNNDTLLGWIIDQNWIFSGASNPASDATLSQFKALNGIAILLSQHGNKDDTAKLQVNQPWLIMYTLYPSNVHLFPFMLKKIDFKLMKPDEDGVYKYVHIINKIIECIIRRNKKNRKSEENLEMLQQVTQKLLIEIPEFREMCQNKDGDTPAHIAFRRMQKSDFDQRIAEALLHSLKIDICKKNNKGETALYWAKMKRFENKRIKCSSHFDRYCRLTDFSSKSCLI